MNEFDRDNVWQREQRDQVLVPGLYQKMCNKFILLDEGPQILPVMQQELGIDTIAEINGKTYMLEEKIVRWPGYEYKNFCLETQSCTKPGREKDGWMKYGRADYLVYAFQTEDQNLDTWLIDFQRLKSWFWGVVNDYEDFQMETINATKGKKVPISDISKKIPTKRFYVKKPPQLQTNKEWLTDYEQAGGFNDVR